MAIGGAGGRDVILAVFVLVHQLEVALPFEALVGVDGISQIFPEACADALLDAVADNEKRGGSESSGDRKKREQKLRSQTDLSHAGCLPLGMPPLEANPGLRRGRRTALIYNLASGMAGWRRPGSRGVEMSKVPRGNLD